MSSVVKERPILFSGAMVRALLAGTKTQTRRIVKDQPSENSGIEIMHNGTSFAAYDLSDWVTDTYQGYGFQTDDELWRCPYGQPGDRLWVRETHGKIEDINGDFHHWAYRADETIQVGGFGGWKPSIHMPRAASRLLLEITAVRVERVQDISEADAQKEGVESCIADLERFGARARGMKLYRNYGLKRNSLTEAPCGGWDNARQSFESLWVSINGAGSWKPNPWVWVVEFKVIEGGKELAQC